MNHNLSAMQVAESRKKGQRYFTEKKNFFVYIAKKEFLASIEHELLTFKVF